MATADTSVRRRLLALALACGLLGAGCPSPHSDHLIEVGSDAPCVACHPLPADHQAKGRPTTCESCHSKASWGAAAPDGLSRDRAHDLTITALIPSYEGTSIASFTALDALLPMNMSHASPDVAGTTLTSCSSCHAASGSYFPGVFHPSLDAQGIAQPVRCASCHAASVPTGFVGPTATRPPRTPPSGEMKHDAVAWSQDAPTGTALVTDDCGACHASPAAWNDGVYHPGLARSGKAQPSSCLDCHANTRPTGLLTSGNAALPAGVKVDHSSPATLGDCVTCHGDTTSWSGGRYHLAASVTPATCLPCHADERPRNTDGWTSTTYANRPFDYGTNVNGLGHGAGLDCVACHDGPGAGGAWGGSQTWKGGAFEHGDNSLSATTCSACHTTQRPLLPVSDFDHAADGTGDCFGCHQATVAARRYESYPGDWMGGEPYPGSTVVTSGDSTLMPTELELVFGATGLITGMTARTAALTSGMLHTSSGLPTAIAPGPTGHPDNSTCWHCHVSDGTVVTAYADGRFHAALDSFTAAPGGPIAPLAQPTSGCAECHAQTRPAGIVERASSPLEPMDHAARFTAPVSIGGTTASSVLDLDCSVCHRQTRGIWDDGVFHAKIDGATPADCTTCHYPGMVDASADITSGSDFSMRHRSSQLPFQACQTCHPDALAKATQTPVDAARWKPGTYHAHLAAKPTACLDCHGGSRPTTLLTSANAMLPKDVTLDHARQDLQGECAACHGSTTSWSGGLLHLTGSATPTTCLPCHAGERPTTTAGWKSTTYASSPFDYVTNANGVTHGAGRDCVACHAGPGEGGAWGGSQTWKGGAFVHGAGTISGTTCIACHLTQRPGPEAAAVLGFDHSTGGTGDCFGCHQPTVREMRYTHYVNPATGTLPGGDWRGGESYPGTSVVSSGLATLTLMERSLVRGGGNGLITGMTSVLATLTSGMLHTATGIPAEVNPGPASSPDATTCWHCHESTGTAVTSYLGGELHAKLQAYTATPGGPVSPLPQPTSGCVQCHAGMRPTGIVTRAGSQLAPMDHAAAFVAPTMIGGVNASSALDLDCSACHQRTSGKWDDGRFHAAIAGAVPADCSACHYPMMVDPAADATSGTRFAMKHRSTQLTFQSCQTCHHDALAAAAGTPTTAALWNPGAHHPNLLTQPTACLDCHAGSGPAGATPSATTYVFAMGGTSSNGPQWMSHASSYVTGRDCAFCHATDARKVGSAWSDSTSFHAAVTSVTTCQGCHGLTNGKGSTPGTNNNLPATLTDSSTVTTADASTGVPAGTHDQISHTDVNVSSHDCGFCHTQIGVASGPPAQGKEWAQAKLHLSFTSGNSLVMNGTTGRCSHCHLNVKPGPSFPFDHGSFTATSAQDCSGCHVFPGTGTPASPNWLGAVDVPSTIDVGGFTIPAPPAPSPTTQTGVANLAHPASGTCTSCHATMAGGRPAIGYDHLSSLINVACNACHESGSDLLGTTWNGATSVAAGAGDSRPFTLPSVTATHFGSDPRQETYPNHFYPVDCGHCHRKPAGNGQVTTGAAYRAAWAFPHPPEGSACVSWCLVCHTGTCPGD